MNSKQKQKITNYKQCIYIRSHIMSAVAVCHLHSKRIYYYLYLLN